MEDKWISVEDRLPEEYTKCLIFSDDRIYTALACSGKGDFILSEHTTLFGPITHWMILPEPPTIANADDILKIKGE